MFQKHIYFTIENPSIRQSVNPPIPMNPPILQSANSPIATASAVSPGRLDVMGGIADYSGSLLLQMPVGETTRVQINNIGGQICSITTDTDEKHQQFSIDIKELRDVPYDVARERIKAKPGGQWAVYIIGCFLVLEKEKGLTFTGADILVSSSIPTGKGVSSSAAVEVATMHAIQKTYGILLDPLELALLAQKVENLVVGAACGLMDQLSVNLGKKDHLLPIICQPHQVMEPIEIPPDIIFFGIDSGVRHAVSGASYGSVRSAAFMAYTIIARSLGVEPSALERAKISGHWKDIPYHGFLANIPLEEFENRYASIIPAKMSGKEFIQQFGTSIDKVTVVHPHIEYHLLPAAWHPVRENHRINRFRTLLLQLSNEAANTTILEEMGKLMFESHEGYSSVGLGEEVTQSIVNKVRDYGINKGVYGARISGGGSGGTVVIMADTKNGIETVRQLHQSMQQKTGRQLYLFSGSSDGAHYVNALL